MLPRFALLAALATFAPTGAYAIDLQVVGAWSTAIDAGDLVGGAGTDLAPTHDSAPLQTAVDIATTTSPTDAWRVDVRRSDTSWDPAVRVWVRRSSDGTGAGSVSGGTSWVEVTSGGTTLFDGQGDRAGVGLQVRLTGLSVGVAVDTHATTLVYTVVDT